MANVEFYRDKRGAACARGEDQRLATFLESDLQESVKVTQDLIALLADRRVCSEFNGNGHSVRISPKMATIESNCAESATPMATGQSETNLLPPWTSEVMVWPCDPVNIEPSTVPKSQEGANAKSNEMLPTASPSNAGVSTDVFPWRPSMNELIPSMVMMILVVKEVVAF